MISKYKFYLMWFMAFVILIMIGTCKVARTEEILKNEINRMLEEINETIESFDMKKKGKELFDWQQLLAEREYGTLGKNRPDTGIWTIRNYVDEFGDPIKEKFIGNTLPIYGTFSNTATQNSALNVIFLINDLHNISIQLYEYAGNNPVKAHSSEKYTVLMKDKNENRFKLKATNWSDRLKFSNAYVGPEVNHIADSTKVHNALMKGGTIKFVIIENNTPTTRYKFTIKNANGYKKVYKELGKWQELKEMMKIADEEINAIIKKREQSKRKTNIIKQENQK